MPQRLTVVPQLRVIIRLRMSCKNLVAAAYRELRDRGSQAQNASLTLLDHPDPPVRGWAGAHALEFSPEDGGRALTDLVAAGGLAGFNAEMTLKTRRKGNLHVP